jgi:hypothetical protein
MERHITAKNLLLPTLMFLIFSVVFAIVSLFPVATGEIESIIRIDDSFNLSPNEVHRQGVGSFHGGENLTVQVECPTAFAKNFSIVTYNGMHYNTTSSGNFTYTFTVEADTYELVFSNVTTAGAVNIKATVDQPQVILPFSLLNTPAKILFIGSLTVASLVILKVEFTNETGHTQSQLSLPVLSRKHRRIILLLVLVSLIFWLAFLGINSNPLATFENWYTDHARHDYVSSLFLNDGFAVFNQPLGVLASQDNSSYKFVTWPEMPHLYPMGSILLFLPFGALLQTGLEPSLVYKLEIALFLFVASVCLFFFLKVFLKKNLCIPWKLVGVCIIYIALITYAADGMFDSVPFLFALFGITMLLVKRYDGFFLLIGISVFFKYQTAIFLLPLIVYGILKLLEKHRVSLLRNKTVIAGTAFLLVSAFTAYLSAPYLIQTKPELIMNGINAFSPNAQIPWTIQASGILLTAIATIAYSLYMLNKRPLLSMSSLFLLVPSFMLPFFQNWYIPFIFVYILIPQQRKELEATTLWLIFIIAMLSFGATAFNPQHIIENFRLTLKI